MPRFAPCGREYRCDAAGQFSPGKKELCRAPRFCPHCEVIHQLREELHQFRYPRTEALHEGLAHATHEDYSADAIVVAAVVTDTDEGGSQ
jgi:hypothetical protein